MVGYSGFNKYKWVAFFLAPSLLGLLTFIVLPMLASIGFALTDWTLPRQPNFIGLQNFQNLLNSAQFWNALRFTVLFILLYVPSVFVAALALGMFFNRKLPGMIVVRVTSFMPVVASWVVVSLIWRWIFNPTYGPVNYWLSLIGIEGPAWLYQADTALIALVITSVWKDVGYYALLFLGGLQSIPETYYEAARIDGAGRWDIFRRITVPLLTPTMFFVIITLIIGYFQIFDAVWLMPVENTAADRELSTIVVEVVKNAFSYNRMGYASAMSWVLFGLIFVITFIQLRVQKRWVYYEID
ncbi:MAG: sugar ABC transporter permease [Chloroflexota bacterium]|mgnify:CR=1 FL=1